MSAADRFTEELANGATALAAVHSLLTRTAPDSTAGASIQDPTYLAHAVSNLRHASAEVEFIALGLHRRTAHNDTYPDALRDLLTTLAAGLAAANRTAHDLWRVMSSAERHGDAIKAATRGTPVTTTATADRFATETTSATNGLSAAHTILAGLSQDYYGGRAVLSAAITAQALSTLRQVTVTVTAIVRALSRHVSHAADNPGRPDAVREMTAALAADLTSAVSAARATVRALHPLERQAADICQASQHVAFTL